jgi:hypothetical protein
MNAREHVHSATRRLACWIVPLLIATELCGRELARRSLLLTLFGARPRSAVLLLMAIAAAVIASLTTRSRRERTALLFVTLFTAGVAAQLDLGARLQSDGFYYFAYLRSIAFDRDVDFTNDYRMLGLGDKTHLFAPTPTGHAQSAWTIGPAIVWSPFFAVGHVTARRLAASGAEISVDGTSFPYRQAVCLAGLFYGLLGCWFSYRAALRFFPAAIAATSTALVIAGSFLLWYLVKEPSMTHAPSAAAVAGFTWLWLETRGAWTEMGTTNRRSALAKLALLGAVAGLMTLIRWQNALFAVLPASDAIMTILPAARVFDTVALRRTILAGLVFTAGATIAFTPQMAAWKSIYGSWLAVSPIGPQIRWTDPHLADILWSSRNGLLSWSPALYCGLVGLLIFAVRQPAAGVPLLLAVALMTYFNACVQDWWGSAGFGGRRFDGTIPLFVVGFAAFTTSAVTVIRRYPLGTFAAVGALLVAWNLSLLSVANSGLVRLGEGVSFGEVQAQQARALHRWIGNPFTYPASLLFALRNGVAPSNYDLLAANRFLSDPLRPYGRIDVGIDDEELLGEGWYGQERDGTTTFRWAASTAGLIVPLDHAAPLLIQARLHAFAFRDSPPQQLTISVNGHALQGGPVDDAWQLMERSTESALWRSGVNRVDLAFSRATRPVDVGMGGDDRLLAAAVDYVRVAVIK